MLPPPIRTVEVNLGDFMEVLLSHGIVPFVSVWFTSAGFQKTHAPLRAAARRFCDNHLQINCLARMCSPSTSRNPIRYPQVNRRDDHWEGPVDQSFLWVISVGSVSISEFYFLSVTSVSSYQWIYFWVAFCIIFV